MARQNQSVTQVYLYIWLIGEGVVVSNGREEHLYADDEVLYQSSLSEFLSPLCLKS